MRTSHLVIILAMILALGAMSFLYLHDREKIKQQARTKAPVPTLSPEELRLKQLLKENEDLKDKQRIAQLEEEILSLKQKTAPSAPDLPPSLYTPQTPQESSELEALRAENERLKMQHKMALQESSIIESKNIENKQKEAERQTYITQARPVGKVFDVNTSHHFVIIAPIGQPNFKTKEGEKERLYICQNNEFVLALTVDSLDAQTGNYIAFISADTSLETLNKIKKDDTVILAWAEDTLPEKELPQLPVTHQTLDGSTVPHLPNAPSASAKEKDQAPPLPELSQP